jgi:hypothetical protein
MFLVADPTEPNAEYGIMRTLREVGSTFGCRCNCADRGAPEIFVVAFA